MLARSAWRRLASTAALCATQAQALVGTSFAVVDPAVASSSAGPAAGDHLPLFKPLQQCLGVGSHHTCKPAKAQAFEAPSWDDLDSDSTRRELRGLRIAIVGDSQGQEFELALNGCLMHREVRDALALNVTHVGFHTVPHLMEDLMSQLREVARSADVLVFSFGSWYNWKWEKWRASDLEYPANRTPSEVSRWRCRNIPNYSMEGDVPFAYATYRRQCRTIGIDCFVSDLRRFRDAVALIKEEFPGLRLFWKTIPPQHFATPSGQFDFAKPISNASCMPVQNATAAYVRNVVANKVLGHDVFHHSFARQRWRRGVEGENLHSNSRALLEVLDTWNYDVDKYGLHMGGDCTHFCNPSAVTWNWARALVTSIIAPPQL